MKKVTGATMLVAIAMFLFVEQSSGQQTLAEKLG